MKAFFQEALHELSQVTWLTRNQAIRISIITIIFVLVSAVALWAVDTAMTEVYKAVQ